MSNNEPVASPPQLLIDRRNQPRIERRKQPRVPSRAPAVVRLHDCDMHGFADIAAEFGSKEYAYVVTPNVDHLIRFCDDESFRALYAEAGYVLNDSRLLSRVVGVSKGIRLRVCTGSDLTEQLFSKVVNPDDRIVLVGSTAEQAAQLEQRFGLQSLKHIEPPFGFINDPKVVEECLRFVEEQSPFRFCFLAVGSPQQEMLANMLRGRGVARGLTLCVGASIDFLTNVERRAPRWMQNAGLEWAFRLMQDPRRLAKRYLIRGPRIFLLLKRIRFELLQVPVKELRSKIASITKS
jgi:N-acetylglucosaminyldiphosphoundecaprenol N-acetyl-beta-D-mannosaminyltransferase